MIDTIFSPSFGNRPKQMIGRDQLLNDVTAGLQSVPGSRDRAIVLLGQRGSGKTVLLWEIADLAKDLDYVVATPTVAFDGMLERIVEKVQDSGEKHLQTNSHQISGGSIGVLGFTAGLQFTKSVQETKSTPYKLVQLARKITEYDKGLLILIDELQANSSDIKQLVITYQEMVSEGLNVALVMAGLPGAVSATLNDKVLTFLNRARKIVLDPLNFSDIDAYFADSFKELEINVSTNLRTTASSAVNGSPYLLQLIGHNIVAYSGKAKEIDTDTMDEAICAATKDFKNDICKTSLAALSDTDVLFLQALAEIGSPAKMSEITQSLEKSNDYVQKYRLRLLEAGIIESPKRGYVSIAIPYLESYLQEHHE